MVVHPHFQVFLYVFTLVAAVCLGLLFVKQKGVAASDADTPPTYPEGARVELVDLKTASLVICSGYARRGSLSEGRRMRSKLNGATGHVLWEPDAGTGRIAVKLISGTVVAVKPKNLKLLCPPCEPDRHTTFILTWSGMVARYMEPDIPLDLLRDAAEQLEEEARDARRELGGEHPFVAEIERSLQESRAAYTRAGGTVLRFPGGQPPLLLDDEGPGVRPS